MLFLSNKRCRNAPQRYVHTYNDCLVTNRKITIWWQEENFPLLSAWWRQNNKCATRFSSLEQGQCKPHAHTHTHICTNAPLCSLFTLCVKTNVKRHFAPDRPNSQPTYLLELVTTSATKPVLQLFVSTSEATKQSFAAALSSVSNVSSSSSSS